MRLLGEQLPQRTRKAVLFDATTHEVCRGLQLVAGIAHGDTRATVANHRQVVGAIAEAVAILAGNAEVIQHHLDARCLRQTALMRAS